MRKYRIIGLTGPTGSGKSIAADIFRQLGFSVVNADELSRKSLRKGSVTLRILQAIFGNDIADSSGEPNRQLIAQRAFSSKENTKILNAVTHSQIYMLAMAEFKALTDSGAENIVFDAPTLLDGNGQFVRFHSRRQRAFQLCIGLSKGTVFRAVRLMNVLRLSTATNFISRLLIL